MEKQQVKFKPLTGKQKFDLIWNIIFLSQQILSLLGIANLFYNIHSFRQVLIAENPSYSFPQYSDLWKVLYILIILVFLKINLEWILAKYVCKKIMSNKYKNPLNKVDYLEGKYLPKKMATHIFKIIFYTITSVIGYRILLNVDYFPKSCLGKGNMKNMFSKGFPNSFYHVKPEYFDLYYLFCLAYFTNDIFFLIFVHQRQNDFIQMLLHHTCTISLILFSYLTNYSNMGIIVLFIHMISDIPNHVAKICLKIDVPKKIVEIAGLLFVVSFIYFRLFVLGQVIYSCYYYINWKWDSTLTIMVIFLVFLYMMHINWTSILLYKFYELIRYKKASDNEEFIVCQKENENLKKKI